MKKPSLLILALLATMISCSKTENKTPKATPTASTLSITLNGIDKSVANKMMDRYINLRGEDSEPLKTSVWFDSTTMRHMYNLLASENADGVRLYFITEGVSDGHLKNSIALVSTRYNAQGTSVPWGTPHVDYYEHAAGNILFSNLKAIAGLVTYGTTNESLLYTTCGDCQPETINNTTNPHSITRQTAEVMVQGFGNHPINTISEWFDLAMFKGFAGDNVHDGVRIYFATKPQGGDYSGHDAFVFTKTLSGLNSGVHIDDMGNNITSGNKSISQRALDGGGGAQDNGELCPDNCTQ